MISIFVGLVILILVMVFVDFGIFIFWMGFRMIIISKLYCIGVLELGCDLG